MSHARRLVRTVMWCGPLDLARLLTESPCVMTTEVLDIRQLVQSPVKVG
jgi:hypothetical protein